MCSLNLSYAVGSAAATVPKAVAGFLLWLILSPYGSPSVGAVGQRWEGGAS